MKAMTEGHRSNKAVYYSYPRECFSLKITTRYTHHIINQRNILDTFATNRRRATLILSLLGSYEGMHVAIKARQYKSTEL
mmetsp:Transcript_14089/g.30312  ORF Transcript_14089/g.30312 Transcript_14089/m.30312 type:complete len:80 (-) Transcript_14089:243-482(-)